MESRQRMNQLLKLLAHDPAVNAILQKKNCLGNLGLQEEALLLAAGAAFCHGRITAGRSDCGITGNESSTGRNIKSDP